MAEHTPGPWKVDERWPASIRDAAGMVVCEAPLGPSKSGEENYANARLMAAAPELLAACRYALSMLRRTVRDGGQEVTLALRLAGLGGCRAEKLLTDALAKAEAPHA